MINNYNTIGLNWFNGKGSQRMAGKKRKNIGHNKNKEIKTSCTINVFTPYCPQLVS